MLERNVDQTDLSKDATISRPALNAILSGKSVPGVDTLEQVAKALGVDIVETLCTEEQARILRKHPADVARLQAEQARTLQEVADLRKRVEEQGADLRKLVEQTQHKSDAVKPPHKKPTSRRRDKASDSSKRPRARKGAASA
jgi:transcriptional regulator with XRE-family HTH domain